MSSELTVAEPGGKRRVVPLKGERLTLGRSTHNELSYPGQNALSRRHALFVFDEGAWWVEDLASRNGTHLNSERLRERSRLRHGDRIRVAELELTFRESGAASSAASVTFETTKAPVLEAASQVTDLKTILTRSKSSGSRPITGEMPTPRFADATSALLRVGRELAIDRPLSELFEIVLDLATEALGIERGLLMTLEEGELIVRARRGDEFRISKSVREKVIDQKLSVIVTDVAIDPVWESHQSIVAQGIRSLIAVPLQTDEQVIGLLYLDSTGGGRRFATADLELITVMANVAAIRIERRRLAEVERQQQILERELDQAADIQRQCLPGRPPQIPGYDLAGYSAPCRTVGGDYYGFFPRADGKLAIVLGDVAGKGMPAALLMMNLQARVQILAEDLDDPAQITRRLNDTLLPICLANRFVTLFIAILDPASGEVTYCNAGHERPLWIRSNGAVDELAEGGPVVGLFPGLDYRAGRCLLEPGDSLALFTDGITEAGNRADEQFGCQRIADLFGSLKGVGAEQAVAQLEQQLGAWLEGSPAHDDATAVVLFRC